MMSALESMLPQQWQREIADYTLERAVMGETEAFVYRLKRPGCADEFLKAGNGVDGEELRREHDRLVWLDGKGISVPRVLGSYDGAHSVALRMTALPGSPAELM